MTTTERTGPDGTGTVVVGVDGSPESAAALAHALDDAARRGARLRVVCAVRIPEYWNTAYRKGAPPPPPEFEEDARATTRRTVDEAVAAAAARGVGVPVTVDVVTGVPAAVLLAAAQGADHLVLGHRGRGALASAVLGSVGLQCVLHADCPVTTLPREALGDRPEVVVGIDGSRESRAALRFALEEAARRGAGVRVVSVFLPPAYWPDAYGLSAPPTPGEVRAELRSTAQGMVEGVVAEHPELAAVPVELHELEGHPAKVLIDQARGADLLVVGHRGRGGFASALLGSVGLQCVLHAECPVTVVRPTRAAADADPGAGHAPAGRGAGPVVAPTY